MKIILLAPIVSHSIKWANSLSDRGFEVLLVGFTNDKKLYSRSDLRCSCVFLSNKELVAHASVLSKVIHYFGVVKRVVSIIKDYKPIILHVHYATSYGLIGALSNFHPFVLSFWGSDVYEFPKKNFIFKYLLKYNIRKADKILSTSHAMAHEIALYTSKKVHVTPFGIDFKKFYRKQVREDHDIMVGTIKDLQPIYGIDSLIKVFSIVESKLVSLNITSKLLIVGDGPQRGQLEQLVDNLDLSDKVIFVGAVPFEKVPFYHNYLDVFVALSHGESFGVSVIEASACGVPVVVTNVGGLPEVVDNGKTGFVVKDGNIEQAVDAIVRLCVDVELREEMGRRGYEKVKKQYDWINNVNTMVTIYKNVIESYENNSIS